MTIDTNVRLLAFETIQDIINDKAYSNIIINEVLSNNELNRADKSLFTELVYGTLKRKYTLDYFLKPFVQTKLKGWVRQLLWMSIYQYAYLDKIPEHAIIHEAVEIAKYKGGPHNGNVVNGILRNMMRSELPDFTEITDDKKRIAIEYSLPKWLVDHWVTHFGLEKTEEIAQSFLDKVSTTVRVNLTRITVDEAIRRLTDDDYIVELDKEIDTCLHISGKPIIESRLFKDGLVSIQDKSSMFVGEIMSLTEGDKVLDACSAPGGKACHIAEILNGTGHVDATDIHEHKIDLIDFNIKKLRLSNISAFEHDATEKYDKVYDKILVDAPCSGLGVLRHKPEIKYEQSQHSIQSLVEIQLEILNNVKDSVKPGGTIIYSTCTIEQMENENVIYTFLKANKDFEFDAFEHPITGEKVKTMQVLPQDFNSDGFFITRIKRKETY
ncbi:16S rRNA methyltransferase [Staphylococcus shinii]|jgi:16S rRNA (cytosine967-C5)-methyltransferase|uniref:16S rRNA (cytosine(967)-C(5))-methyltransferase n=1 Tax=Staphylococcus shinii TaxID=2912228 RepID=A0A418IES9_9STAP|nr:16S rRNA (cytosine(967)-C(5))-methyltransferase RsmB [Staphylococcus shinii]MBO3064471.1 16S rRNA (cytosine(967)-C(5))-methyltransferase RsmB [Staphylococcus shinii]OEK87400.1 16S rRNA methyltransferase [Staphylococcus shinii]PKI12471.1 16S rRNA (cytosine(967)-C(5))-methyltransferase RsmB [Staphylococcus shinii]PTI02703.1 16S rRNA (cytosine(967)-C(5))-methyltransferase RsmB [Staphylococcus shinii]QRA15724.1 16S rRNA (cytosine(967)-C(5))-methyltransferase RsmB [Staphylococcus shinii]